MPSVSGKGIISVWDIPNPNSGVPGTQNDLIYNRRVIY
jgi:hypothetical protein